ncbi:MAG: polyprenyl synthetase family protein [Defluviitaleaceae bacterium]|nr:polyprenyl synthetase family protein [Defluviitaleaceae bacterium]
MSFNAELTEKIEAVNNGLRKYMELDIPDDLRKAMEYSLFGGGKRLRSVILLSACKMLDGNPSHALPFACGLEMIHTYSLIHDDLPAMDDDDLRRGKPTNHKVFGEGMAILAGDALLNRAFEIMADFCVDNPHPNFLRAMAKIARNAGALGMVGGQAVDIKLAGEPTTHAQLEYIYKNKTAKLFMAAFGAGALCANADENTVDKMVKIGCDLGFAFQALDDIADKDPNAGKIAPPDMGGHLGWIKSQPKGDFLAALIERIVT